MDKTAKTSTVFSTFAKKQDNFCSEIIGRSTIDHFKLKGCFPEEITDIVAKLRCILITMSSNVIEKK